MSPGPVRSGPKCCVTAAEWQRPQVRGLEAGDDARPPGLPGQACASSSLSLCSAPVSAGRDVRVGPVLGGGHTQHHRDQVQHAHVLRALGRGHAPQRGPAAAGRPRRLQEQQAGAGEAQQPQHGGAGHAGDAQRQHRYRAGPRPPRRALPAPSRPRWPGLGSPEKGAPGQPQGVPGTPGHPQPRLHCVRQAWAAVTSGPMSRTSSTPPQSWTWAGSPAWTAQAAGACWAQSPRWGLVPPREVPTAPRWGRNAWGVDPAPATPAPVLAVPASRPRRGVPTPGPAVLPAHWPPSPRVLAARPRES